MNFSQRRRERFKQEIIEFHYQNKINNSARGRKGREQQKKGKSQNPSASWLAEYLGGAAVPFTQKKYLGGAAVLHLGLQSPKGSEVRERKAKA